MTRLHIGIDPGLKGGWGIADTKCIYHSGRLPFTKAGDLEVGVLTDALITAYRAHDCGGIIVEKQAAWVRGRRSAQTEFTIAKNYGVLRHTLMEVCTAVGCTLREVGTRSWQARFLAPARRFSTRGEKVTTKTRALWTARVYWPESIDDHTLPQKGERLDGIVDALLISLYGKEVVG